MSTASSFEAESGRLEELLGRSLPRLSVPDTLAAAAAAVAASSASQQQLVAERGKRQAAEAAVAELRQQLDEIAALVLSFRSRQPAGLQQLQQAQQGQQEQQQQQAAVASSGSGASVATDLLSVLQAAAAQCQHAAEAAAQQAARAHAATAEAEDAALVARMVAGICARAAAAADLGEQWAGERAQLERRLEQAALSQMAMLKHHKEHSAGACWHRAVVVGGAQAVRAAQPILSCVLATACTGSPLTPYMRLLAPCLAPCRARALAPAAAQHRCVGGLLHSGGRHRDPHHPPLAGGVTALLILALAAADRCSAPRLLLYMPTDRNPNEPYCGLLHLLFLTLDHRPHLTNDVAAPRRLGWPLWWPHRPPQCIPAPHRLLACTNVTALQPPASYTSPQLPFFPLGSHAIMPHYTFLALTPHGLARSRVHTF